MNYQEYSPNQREDFFFDQMLIKIKPSSTCNFTFDRLEQFPKEICCYLFLTLFFFHCLPTTGAGSQKIHLYCNKSTGLYLCVMMPGKLPQRH